MRGVREPLLWISLASLATCLPWPPTIVLAGITLALSIHLLLRTPLGSLARPALHFARLAAWTACGLNALLFTPLAAPAIWIALLSVPLALLALAHALRRMAQAGGMDIDEQWFSAVRLLFVGAILAECFLPDIGLNVQFYCAPVLAFLVWQFRHQFPLASAR